MKAILILPLFKKKLFQFYCKGKIYLGAHKPEQGKQLLLQLLSCNTSISISRIMLESVKLKYLLLRQPESWQYRLQTVFPHMGNLQESKNTVVFGGVKQGAQTDALRKGVDVLVATPGRLLDLMNQGFISLKDVEYFVLDEADHMLDMGFIHDIRKIITKLPKKRQSLFFSATMPNDIISLSRNILGKPEKVTIMPEQATAEKVNQAVYFVTKKSKIKLLIHLLKTEDVSSALIFSRTKHGANKIVKFLGKADIKAVAIHGNKSQGARQKDIE